MSEEADFIYFIKKRTVGNNEPNLILQNKNIEICDSLSKISSFDDLFLITFLKKPAISLYICFTQSLVIKIIVQKKYKNNHPNTIISWLHFGLTYISRYCPCIRSFTIMIQKKTGSQELFQIKILKITNIWQYESNIPQVRAQYELGLKVKQNILNHIIFLIILLTSLYKLYLMSFSNYAHLLFPDPSFFPITCFHYQLIPLTLLNRPTEVNLQELQPIIQETNHEYDLNQLNFKILEQNLKYIHSQSHHNRKRHWTAKQDKLLQKLVQVQKLEWKQIPQYFEQRTQNMCYSRYRRISMATKDRLWTPQQQQLLSNYVAKYGEKWKLLSSKLPKFTSKQIRERYLNYLRPIINKEQFTYEQDFKICLHILEHGKHWKKMQEIIPGRSQGSIKGRYYGKLQKIIKKSLGN